MHINIWPDVIYFFSFNNIPNHQIILMIYTIVVENIYHKPFCLQTLILYTANLIVYCSPFEHWSRIGLHNCTSKYYIYLCIIYLFIYFQNNADLIFHMQNNTLLMCFMPKAVWFMPWYIMINALTRLLYTVLIIFVQNRTWINVSR